MNFLPYSWTRKPTLLFQTKYKYPHPNIKLEHQTKLIYDEITRDMIDFGAWIDLSGGVFVETWKKLVISELH